MIVVESLRGRRLVGRLDRGVELLEALLDVCRRRGVPSGEARVHGVVESFELENVALHTEPGARPQPRRFGGVATILSFAGRLGEHGGKLHLDATVTLGREGEAGLEVLGGRLVRARVVAAEFVVEAMDDLVLRRNIDGPGGSLLLQEAFAAAAPAVQPAPAAPVAPAAPAAPVASMFPRVATVVSTSAPPVPAAPAAFAPPILRPAPVSVAPVAPTSAAPAAPAARSAPVPFEVPASGHIVRAAHASDDDDRDDEDDDRIVHAAPRGQLPPLPRGQAPTAATPAASPSPSWAEVARQSAARGEDEDDEPIRRGDMIDHPRFGRCEVERVEGAGEYAQVRLKNRRVVRLSLDVLQLVRDGKIETGQRLFRGLVGH